MTKARVQIFYSRLGWYWRVVAANNRILAVGGEPFKTPANARRAAGRVLTLGLLPVDVVKRRR